MLTNDKQSCKKQNTSSQEEYIDSMLLLDDDSESENYNEETMPIPEEIIYSGLVLKEDYILLKQIGYGNNAKVWMSYQISRKLFVAMKIQDFQCYNDGCREVTIIKKINSYCEENKNIYCVTMLDYFVYEEDDDVKYVCSIYELYAGSIQMVLNSGKHKYGLPLTVVKIITKQLLTTLATLHSKLKIIHTDIKPENILFKGMPEDHSKMIELFISSEFQSRYNDLCEVFKNDKSRFLEELEVLAMVSVKEICRLDTNVDGGDEDFTPDDDDEDDFIEGEGDFDSNSDPDSELNSNEEEENDNCFNDRKQSIDDIIENLDYVDIHDIEVEGEYDFVSVLNNNQNTTDKKEIIDEKYIINCETALTDFGNSYFYEKRTKNEIQDRRYRAPEVVLDFNYGYECDIWSVSCVVFELLTGFVLFEPGDYPVNKDIHHLFLMEKMLGQLPLQMKKTSKRSKFLFDKSRNYHIKNVQEFQPTPLKDRLIKQFLFDQKNADEICDFLMCGLKYNPSERMTAKQMLQHQWLN